MDDTTPKLLNSITNHPDVQRLIGQLVKAQAENKRLKEGYDKILACDFDDKCETTHGLSERYYFVPRSIIAQALAGDKQ